MTIILELPPELEEKALAAAQLRGVSVEDILQQALAQMPAPTAPPKAEEQKPTLWELHHEFLQAMWDAQPDGPLRRTSEIEAACALPEEKRP